MSEYEDDATAEEADWSVYRQLAPAAVPRRVEQLATLIALLPGDVAHVVELGCGEGHLSAAILGAIPGISVNALDGSEEMRKLAAERLREFGPRARVEHFDLEQSDWLSFVEGADAVVSSLALHHLDGSGKERVFKEIRERLTPSGAILIADLVEPQSREALTLFADTWDFAAMHQSIEETGELELFELFMSAEWNHYRTPDPMDKPSPLFEQLKLLERAGFTNVDCFWMYAGHAIYGGYRSRESTPPAVPFDTAVKQVSETLGRGT
jgi:tRNA (cmo5U34)-methyltransferase